MFLEHFFASKTLFYVHLRSPRHVTNSSVLAPWPKRKKTGESNWLFLVLFWGGDEIPNPFLAGDEILR